MIVFPNRDFKYEEWAKEFTLFGTTTYANRRSLVLAPLDIIWLMLKGQKIEAYVFRYLNDRSSFIKSLLLVSSDIMVVALCKLTRIKILWILHNIDKETQCHYPIIVELRRKIIARACCQIFVTDRCLVKYAKTIFSNHKGKISFISFGKYKATFKMKTTKKNHEVIFNEDSNYYKNISFEQLLEKLENLHKSYSYIGFCAGKHEIKKIYYKKLPEFFKFPVEISNKILFVVITDLSEKVDLALFNYLKDNRNIVFVNNLMLLDEYRLAKYVDFYWLGYQDISVPYSVYVASSVKRPILSYDVGVLPELVKEYNIGYTVESDFSNLPELLKKIKKKNHLSYDEFNKTHSWKMGARNMITSISTN